MATWPVQNMRKNIQHSLTFQNLNSENKLLQELGDEMFI